MSSYLLQWYDHDLPVRGDAGEAIEKFEVERLSRLLAIATLVQGMPRRLGPDATADDLARDKVRAKRVSHVAAQLLRSWQANPNGVGDVNREAAQVDWQRWWHEHRVWLINRRAYLATWAIKNDREGKWAKSLVVRINNEIEWLTYAMRD